MGYMRHNAIIVTTCFKDALVEAANEATKLGFHVLGPSDPAINGYMSILVCPDGSKEGWPESEYYDKQRAAYRMWLDFKKYGDSDSCYEWVEVSYNNEHPPEIVDKSFMGRTIFEE